MLNVATCPICGKPCRSEYYKDANDVVVEEYMTCDTCGYFSNMCYGASSKGIDLGSDNPIKCIKKYILYIKHRKKLRELKVSPDPRTWRDSYNG